MQGIRRQTEGTDPGNPYKFGIYSTAKELQEYQEIIEKIDNSSNYKIENNVLCIIRNGITKIAVPEEIIIEFVNEVQKAYGHAGRNKIMNMIKDRWFF